MPHRPASQGQPLLDYLTSHWYNETNRKLNNKVVSNKKTKKHDDFDWTYVYLDEPSSTTAGLFEAVIITDHLFSPPGPHMANRVAKGKIPGASVESTTWGICQIPTAGGQLAKVVLTGLSWAHFTLTDPTHKYINVAADYTLKSAENGPAKILSFTATSGDEGYGLVLLGVSSSTPDVGIFLTDTTINELVGTTPGTGDATQQDYSGSSLVAGTAETLYNISINPIDSGTYLLAFKIQEHWTTDGTNLGGSSPTSGPVQRIYCTLGTRTVSTPVHFAADPRETDAIINTTSIVQLSSTPFSVMPDLSAGTVPNPLKLTGITGDGAILEYNDTTASYFVAHIYPQQQLELWCTLASDAPYGSLQPTVSLTPVTPIGIGAMPSSPFNAKDTFFQAINAKAGHRALVKYNYEDSQYHIVACEHTATQVRGEVNGTTYTSTPATISVDNLQGLNGLTPTTSSITASNRFNVEFFKDNDKVEVHWDPITGTWYVSQAQAPEDPVPVYVN